MFSRLSTSWALVQASASVLRSDKKLIIFPILSSIAALLVTVSFFVPAFVYAYGNHMRQSDIQGPAYYVGLFLFYLVQYFVVFFMNTALVSAALVRLRGGEPTVRDAFGLAWSRVGVIFGYSVLASTVGMVLRTLSERFGLVGRLVIGLIGMAWNIATYLVAPVLIAENVGPVAAVKRSADLLKKTWGEQIVGNVQIGTVFGLTMVLLIVLFIPLIVAAATYQMIALIIIASILLVLAITGLALIQAALGGIYTAAVYLYATEGTAPGHFSADQIRGAFRAK
jgi:hypothetical protein